LRSSKRVVGIERGLEGVIGIFESVGSGVGEYCLAGWRGGSLAVVWQFSLGPVAGLLCHSGNCSPPGTSPACRQSDPTLG